MKQNIKEEKTTVYERQPPRDIISESFRVTIEDTVLEEEIKKKADKRARRIVGGQWY
jgi:hypothetical protein